MAQAAKRQDNDATFLRAKQLLAEAAARVCNTKSTTFMWHEDKDRTTADRVRREILEVLTAMQ